MQKSLESANPLRFEAALQRFDKENRKDPNQERVGDCTRPRELLHAERLSQWVLRLKPAASESLRLAARCQHIRRWEIPRDSHPMTRTGYLQWKETLKRRHAEIAGDILREVGYADEMIRRVQSLNLKHNLKGDADCQTLEDALCLVFLEHQLSDLASRTSEEKVITALRKSWAKMSDQGRDAAMKLEFNDHEKQLLDLALQ